MKEAVTMAVKYSAQRFSSSNPVPIVNIKVAYANVMTLTQARCEVRTSPAFSNSFWRSSFSLLISNTSAQ